ncbi:hypothetical protein [Parasphaerochaeta coccoides]|uniref:Uncharacterized protein n=1 Tax=Parasphaerochaeta coccoides (strain ATCC BAA-1237 / DSM 17374 / SPN1) TaxID=760011 RepID=F4GJF6_PARC1|nr:hypothetical protein [Parasphaerochaeta coccoides]AEC02221.1 hypothetical protein Spico_0998 [Parasphaerochaeta coccoides DSM 17374]
MRMTAYQVERHPAKRYSVRILHALVIVLSIVLTLTSCAHGSTPIVRYGWFESEGIILIEMPAARAFLSVSLPLDILQEWYGSGEAGSDPSAFLVMASFSGLPSSGTFGGTAENLADIRSLLDTLVAQDSVLSQATEPASRIQILEKHAGDLRKTSLPATLNGLSGLDAAALMRRSQGGGRSMAYDAAHFLDSSMEITEVRAWFVSWLQGAMDEISLRSIKE